MTPTATISAVLTCAGMAYARAGAGTPLDPVQPVVLPNGAMAKNPLAHLGGNGPWTTAPNVNGIPPDVPKNCYVDQAAYVLRHGSRYPDPGAHSGWLDMARRFREGDYSASGPLSFVHRWDTPLAHPEIQLSQLSQTGYKELSDLGYTLRTRYPNLYQEGEDFYVWANNYTRVIQTAQLFVRGYLGPNSTLLGKVVSVTGKGFPDQLANTLAPSDMCPAFKDDSEVQQSAWRSRWLPSFIERLSKYIRGNLTLQDSQWNDFPYICGFESQITGRLSPFCDTFTQEELEQYEYQQDLRYYYGLGPGASVSSKMMAPFLNALMQRFVDGPDAQGIAKGGALFKVPRLLMNFVNDGQLIQLAAATGVFDKQKPLPVNYIPRDRLWRSSRISPMRGTIAFERLNCRVRNSHGGWGLAREKNETFVRIRINEAVYPVPGCQGGPGQSCRLTDYAAYIARKVKAIGSFAALCNATDPATPRTVLGASFLTDLDQPHLQIVTP
ncbi:histidine acid phosphatase [Thermothelomyces thermophilus ATCC 42464]|uniref:3-phytase n=1 Tax=Thermothelomyces thermophilus (strain ATCC 42464 / BCRC 31852 / DSM 1799) TaxID=573729 RepID=G2QKX8_THET4|nr:histidine acid phosphatase [Thermothelomyces thermophilus ATCC 42464]AEO60610.1 histidine acid phosphatase [Thermothelomyces thermophilus ATCC 42464]